MFRRSRHFPGGGTLFVRQAVGNGESPGDTEKEDEGEAENEGSRACGTDSRTYDGRGDTGAGQRPVEPAVQAPDAQGCREHRRRAEHDGRAPAEHPGRGGGVRLSWACSTRPTIAAPMAAMAAVSGRWTSIHCTVLARVGLGRRCPAKSKYVHQAPKPTTTATSPTARVSALVGSWVSPSTTPVTVSPSTMMISSPNRSVSASVTLRATAWTGVAVPIMSANPAR